MCFTSGFVVRAHKWDAPTWDTKARPRDDGMACGVNAALSVGSHVDCNTLDRYAETVAAFIWCWVTAGYRGGFGNVVLDDDQAYHRVCWAGAFWCMLPVLSPGAYAVLGSDRRWVLPGQVVLLGEAGAVAAYCMVARTIFFNTGCTFYEVPTPLVPLVPLVFSWLAAVRNSRDSNPR